LSLGNAHYSSYNNGRRKDWDFFNNVENVKTSIEEVKKYTEFTGSGPVLFLIQKKPFKLNTKGK